LREDAMQKESESKITWLNQISLGNALTSLGGLITIGLIYGTTMTLVNAIENKIDSNEKSDKEVVNFIVTLKERTVEISSEQKSFRRDVDRISEQLNRIENILRRSPNPPTTP